MLQPSNKRRASKYEWKKFDVESSSDSDEELQLALEDGRLKPGINIEIKENTALIHNARLLEAKLSSLQLNLPWIERLDVSSAFRPDVHADNSESIVSTNLVDRADERLSKDDIKRELCIMDQAQQSVIEAIPMLNELGIPVVRPSDYFAEMAKSDIHMAKVSKRLEDRIVSLKEKQRLRQLRELKKHGKQIQIAAEQRKMADKREMGELLKKHKKGDKTSMEMIKQKIEGRPIRSRQKPRQSKNRKFGGKKRGRKVNTAESSASVSKFKGKKGTFNKGKKNPNRKLSSNKKGKTRR